MTASSRPVSSLPGLRIAALSLVVLATGLVAGCGGSDNGASSGSASGAQGGTSGGGSGAGTGQSSPAPGTSSSSPAPGTSSSSPAPGTAANCGQAEFVQPALELLNARRAAGATCGSQAFGPAGPLSWNAQLTQAAQGHSVDMAAKDYFSHTSQDGRSFGERIDATGYKWSSIAENIAAGYPTVQKVVDGWMASEGHCRNIMNAALSEIGLACAPSSTAKYPNYWTLDLARPAG